MNLLVGYFLVLSFIPQMQEGIYNDIEGPFVQDYVNLDAESFVSSANVGLSFRLDRLLIEPSVKTYMLHYSGNVFFNPFQADYEIKGELDLIKGKGEKAFLTLGVYHICIHPVTYLLGEDAKNTYFAQRTEVYIRMQGIF